MWHTAQYTDYGWHACMPTGIIISPELNSQKKFWESVYISGRVCLRGCQEHATKEETYTVKTCSINGSIKTMVHHWIVASTICVHNYSLKPILTEENKLARVLMAMHFRDPQDPTKYQDIHDQIHLDEKWFFLTWEKE